VVAQTGTNLKQISTTNGCEYAGDVLFVVFTIAEFYELLTPISGWVQRIMKIIYNLDLFSNNR